MSMGEWVAVGFLAVMAIVGFPGVVRLWRGEVAYWLKPQNWWLYSRRTWYRWIKAMSAFYVSGIFMILGLPILIYVSVPLGLLMALLFFAGFALGLSVMIFNRPRWLIPPRLRSLK